MLYGIGNVAIGTNALNASSLLGQNLAFNQCVASVAFNNESNSVKSMCYVNGIKQKKASRINSENFTVELTYEYLSWSELQLLYGELSQSKSNVYVPTSVAITPTTTTFTVSDITVANANVGSFRLYDATTEEFMTLSVAAPTAGEYQITTAGAVTLHSSAIGRTLIYKYDKKYTSIDAIGASLEGAQVDQLSNLNLTAILSSSIYPKGLVLVVDRLERVNTPSFSIADDKATITITYDCITLPGRQKPFTLFKLDGAVAA